MTSITSSPPRAPPVKYKTPLGTRWQKEKAAAERGAFEYPDDAKFVGPWIIGECVGKGASGHVKIARHRRTGQLAAVKILPIQPFASSRTANANANANAAAAAGAAAGGGGGNHQGQVQSQQEEAAAAAKSEKQRLGIDREITMMKLMNHPNIMRIYDVYEGERELYLILEYVEGGELFDFLVNRGKLAPLEALGYFKQIVYGLNYAHTFSIIHRDLKPENILIHSLNPPLVKIADWGMAAFAPPSLQLETSCGSPHYASPEIVNGFKYTGTATDIWSCGVILYALLTGRLPFDDKNVRNLLAKVKLGRYEMPAFVDPLAKDLLSRMLVVDVTKRITMAEILNHPWLETETPGITYVPAPPVAELAQPLPSALHIDRDLFESLCVIWGRHANPEMIKGDLLSPAGQGTLAKAFYFLLLKHRERTMEEHGILMDVTDVLNAAPGKVVTKQYSAPRARSKTLQLAGWDSHVATTAYHQSHPQHHSHQTYGQTPYNHHHLLRYSHYQTSNLRSTRPAPAAPAGPRPRTPSPVTSPQPVSHHGQNVRQPMSLPPIMDRPPSRPHPPSPAGPRPQRPRPTSSPPTTLMRPNLNKAIGHPEFLALMRGTTGHEHLRPPAVSRRMLPAMERTGAMMSSSAPGSGTTSGTGTGTGSMGPGCYTPQVRGATRFDVCSNGNENVGMESPVMPPTPQNSVFVPLPQSVQGSPHVQAPIQPQIQAQAQLSVGTVVSQGQGTPMIHAPVPVQATSTSSLVLPMITAPRVQDEALQRTMDYCASLVNGQAMSWNASVAKELEKERERLGSGCGPAGGKSVVLGVSVGGGMVNEEFGKSRVALGEAGGSQFHQVSGQGQGQMNSGSSAMRMQEDFGPQQQQQQLLHRHQQYVQSEQQGEKKMDVDTPKKGEDKENWDQQVSVVAGANAPGQSESGGLGFGSSVPMGREMGNMMNVDEPVTSTPAKGKGREGKRPPHMEFMTPPSQSSAKKMSTFAALLGSPTVNSNAMPLTPPPPSSTTAMLLGSPVVGEFKGWFSNLFHWKPHSFVLHSIDDIIDTKREVLRLLESYGVGISFEDPPPGANPQQVQQQQQEGWAPIRCKMDEVYDGSSVVQKQVRFKVEFSMGPGGVSTGSFIGSPRVSSPMSPLSPPAGPPSTPLTNSAAGGPPSLSSLPLPLPVRNKTSGSGVSSPLVNGENTQVQVVVAFTLEKGAVSGFKSVCAYMRAEWRLEGMVVVPLSPRSPKFGVVGGVNTSIEQRMMA